MTTFKMGDRVKLKAADGFGGERLPSGHVGVITARKGSFSEEVSFVDGVPCWSHNLAQQEEKGGWLPCPHDNCCWEYIDGKRVQANVWHGLGCLVCSEGVHSVSPRSDCPCGLTYDQAVERGHIPRAQSPAPQPKGDRYAEHRRTHPETADDALVAAMTDRLLPNWLARKRLMAALTAELGQSTASRKAQLAFPSEARSCRVYRSNDR